MNPEDLEKLLTAHNDAQWDCAEWTKEDGPYYALYRKSVEAENALRAAIGLRLLPESKE